MNEEPNLPTFLCFIAAFVFACGAYIAHMIETRRDDDRDE